jgi:hypothetical protein
VALAPLATAADLLARKIDVTDSASVVSQLAAASAAVRNAARVAITKQMSTVTLWTEASRRIELPARPVRSVTSVTLDGVALVAGTDYLLRGSSLWRDKPWQSRGEIPSELVVTFVHGLDAVPDDIVDLVCALAGAGLAAIADGFKTHTGVQSESIDDYRVGYATGADAVSTVMDLPDRVEDMLRERFGSGGPTVIGTVR